jgi:coiled-coil domain-containing protein 130
LEGRVAEKGVEKRNKERVEELYERAMVWEDPYARNRELRNAFRVRRKGWEREERVKEGMQDKFSFGFEVVDEVEEDGLRAGLVEFGADAGSGGKMDEAARKPLFAAKSLEMQTKAAPKTKTKKLKTQILAEKSRQNLQQTLVGNTRVAIDPFLSDSGRSSSKSTLGMLKRKRVEEPALPVEPPSKASTEVPDPKDDSQPESTRPNPTSTMALVDYDSD